MTVDWLRRDVGGDGVAGIECETDNMAGVATIARMTQPDDPLSAGRSASLALGAGRSCRTSMAGRPDARVTQGDHCTFSEFHERAVRDPNPAPDHTRPNRELRFCRNGSAPGRGTRYRPPRRSPGLVPAGRSGDAHPFHLAPDARHAMDLLHVGHEESVSCS
jgi:hypothetical protein